MAGEEGEDWERGGEGKSAGPFLRGGRQFWVVLIGWVASGRNRTPSVVGVCWGRQALGGSGFRVLGVLGVLGAKVFSARC